MNNPPLPPRSAASGSHARACIRQLALVCLFAAAPLVAADPVVLFSTGFEHTSQGRDFAGNPIGIMDGTTPFQTITGTDDTRGVRPRAWDLFSGGASTGPGDRLGAFKFNYESDNFSFDAKALALAEPPNAPAFVGVDEPEPKFDFADEAPGGKKYLRFNADSAADNMTLKVVVPSEFGAQSERNYRVTIRFHTGPDRGKYKVLIKNGQQTLVAKIVETYSATAGFQEEGQETEIKDELSLASGTTYTFRFICEDKHNDSQGYKLGIDTITLDPLDYANFANFDPDPDPANSGNANTVLKFRIEDSVMSPTQEKGRVQADITGNPADLKVVTSVVKMFIPSDSWQHLTQWEQAIEWLSIQELWTNPVVSGGKSAQNFRITLKINKKADTTGGLNPPKLYWAIDADEAGGGGTLENVSEGGTVLVAETSGDPFWKHNTSTDENGVNPTNPIWVDDIFNQWVTLVLYYKKGDADYEVNGRGNGRLRVKIIKADGTSQELFNITDHTCHPSPQPYKYALASDGKMRPVIGTDGNVERHDQDTGLTKHQPMKLYGPKTLFDYMKTVAGGTDLYWDDFEYIEGDAYGVPGCPTIRDSNDFDFSESSPGDVDDNEFNYSAAMNGKGRVFMGNAEGDFIEYQVNVPTPGTYHITVGQINHVNRGIYQLYVDGIKVGRPHDGYRSSIGLSVHPLGTFTFVAAGNHTFRFECTGINAVSGSHRLGLDYITLQP